MGRVFANGPEFSPKWHQTKEYLKMVPDASLLNTQQYVVRIKGKVKQSRERSSAPHVHLSVVAVKKAAFGSPSTTVANFTLFISLYSFTNNLSYYKFTNILC